MIKDEDNYEPFTFTDVQLVELKALLGDSQSVEGFLGVVEGWINDAIWVRGKGKDKYKYAPVTLRQMIDRLDKYERFCTEFVQGVSAIEADLSKPNLDVGEIDWPAIMKIEAAQLTDADGHRQDFTDGFVSDVVESVRTLGNLCKTAKESIPPPEKGGLTPHEIMFQRLEDGIVEAFAQAFGRYPAKTDGGAFHEAMSTFYELAGYPGSNSYQRVWKAVDRCTEAAGHGPIPE